MSLLYALALYLASQLALVACAIFATAYGLFVKFALFWRAVIAGLMFVAALGAWVVLTWMLLGA